MFQLACARGPKHRLQDLNGDALRGRPDKAARSVSAPEWLVMSGPSHTVPSLAARPRMKPWQRPLSSAKPMRARHGRPIASECPPHCAVDLLKLGNAT